MTDVEKRLAALEARVRELETAAAKRPLSSFEWAQPIRRLPSIFVGPEWIGPRSYE